MRKVNFNYWYLAVLLFLNSSITPAQYADLKFRHITTVDGLSQGTATSFYQDDNGFIWIGTRDGLNRFDGYAFTVFKHNSNDSSSLSINHVKDIVKNSDDKLWIATWGGGVDLFDLKTQKFSKYFQGIEGDNLLKSFIHCLLRDSKGNLWIGTDGEGMYAYIKNSSQLIRYMHQPDNPGSISDNTIRDIYEDKEGNLWIGTQNGGLNLFDRKSNSFIKFKQNPKNNKSPSANHIRAITELGSDYLCLGTYGAGLDILNKKTGVFQNFRHDIFNNNSLCHDNIISLFTDSNGKLWIGSENGGLSIFDLKTGVFHNYRNDEFDNSSLNNNSLYAIFEDFWGNFWLGTWNGGINMVYKDAQQFIYYRHNSSPTSLSDNHVLCITEDSDGYLWVGTDGGGLNMLDPATGKFTHFTHNENNKNSISGNYILSVCEDKNKEIWIGTYGNGISIYNKNTRTFRHLQYEPGRSGGLTSNFVWSVFRDSHDKIWIGLCPGGINVYNPDTRQFTYYLHNENDTTTLSHNNIHSIYEDRLGNIWIGTNGGGLNKIDKATGRIRHYKHIANGKGLSHNSLGHIFEDKNGNLWIGTDAGMDFLNTKTDAIINYGQKYNLPNSFIYGIMEDSNQNLWISSNAGLIKFNPDSNHVKYYTTANGLQSNEFNLNAFCKGKDGAMYFGGSNGFNKFYPDKLLERNYNTAPVVTDFLIFNKSVDIAKKGSPLTYQITYTKELTLSYKQSVFSIEFAALNYMFPGTNQYTYKMEGFDKNWNDVKSKRSATYTNLDPGDYVFKVRTGLGDRLNPETVELKITITPPFWITWWFKLLMVVFICLLALAVFRYRIKSIKKRNIWLLKMVDQRTLELSEKNNELNSQSQELNEVNALMEERQQQIEEQSVELTIQKDVLERVNADLNELNATKDKFFSIIAHDIKNPFNSILGFSELLHNKYDDWEEEKRKKIIELIYASSKNTFNLLENLLQWSRSQRGIIEFNPDKLNLRDIIEQTVQLLSHSASEKEIELKSTVKNIEIFVMADPKMVYSILRNLVNNAIKFTNKGGLVVVSAKNFENKVQINVTDNGVGIPATVIDTLFKIDSSNTTVGTKQERGTGLGLILVHEFVIRNGGEIFVESKQGEGSTFSFTLPSTG